MLTKPKFKIAITGPESSGKSTIAAELSDLLDATLVKDYSRIYYENHPFQNSYEEILYIAKAQISAEKAADFSTKDIIIYDSDLINIEIWLAYYQYEVPSFITEHIESNPYDLCLLLYPNTPWIEDELRNNPHDRIQLFNTFKETLEKYQYTFEIIEQLDDERLLEAKEIISKALKS